MRQISDSELRENFANILDTAQKEPIVVKKGERDYVAIISMSEYEDLLKMKSSRLQKLATEIGREARENGLTAEILEDILSGES
jgi:prevent-host-death family protein